VTVLRSGSATDVGRVRHSNQDRLLEEPNLFAVADGMGGHVGGEVAAQVAVDALRVSFARQATVDGLRRAVGEANAAVWREGQEQADLRGMGTTMTAVALVAGADGRDVIALANVGDSRAYVFSGGRAVQVTSDHSLAEEKVRQGELTEAEAAVHPHRHILTRALGVSLDVDVDLWELRLHDGDRILLCSDGLTNEVGTEQIAGTLASTAEPVAAARALVEAAVAHGGNDNVTVLVVDVLVADPESVSTGDPMTGAPAAVDGLAASAAAGAAAGIAAGAGAGSGAAALAGQATPPAGAATDTDRAGQPALTHDSAPDDSTTGVVAAQPAAATQPVTDDQPAATGAVPGVLPADRPAVSDGAPGQPQPGQPEPGEPGPEEPSRRERRRRRRQERRRSGTPRRLTFRVVLFVVLLLVVVGAAYGFLRWYATDNWYVTIEGKHLVIYQGRSGGLLWFKPTLVERTSVTTGEVLPTRLPVLAADQNEGSLANARRYVANLHQEYLTQRRIDRGETTTTTTTFPSTTTTTSGGVTTTAPGGVTTTTVAGAVPTTSATTVP
jgi:serine/threonine protein phosphatase PrpC